MVDNNNTHYLKGMAEEFNKTVNEFFKAMSVILPNDSRVSMYKSTFELAKMMGNSHYGIFMSNLEPYEKQIFTENNDFFDREQCINGVINIPFTMGIGDTWSTLSKDTKNVIWEYFKILYFQCHKALGNNSSELLARIGTYSN